MLECLGDRFLTAQQTQIEELNEKITGLSAKVDELTTVATAGDELVEKLADVLGA